MRAYAEMSAGEEAKRTVTPAGGSRGSGSCSHTISGSRRPLPKTAFEQLLGEVVVEADPGVDARRLAVAR